MPPPREVPSCYVGNLECVVLWSCVLHDLFVIVSHPALRGDSLDGLRRIGALMRDAGFALVQLFRKILGVAFS